MGNYLALEQNPVMPWVSWLPQMVSAVWPLAGHNDVLNQEQRQVVLDEPLVVPTLKCLSPHRSNGVQAGFL